MKTAVPIKAAKNQDQLRIAAMLSAADLPTEDLGPHISFFLWEKENDLIALGGWERYGPHGLLRSIVVQPGLQGLGMGRKWVSALLQTAREHGLEELYLLTTTAAPFFSRMGFQTTARNAVPAAIQATNEFKDICPSSAVCMKKSLV
ncbi:MAG: arsenic resistance N-acetyltransferase ArsN2 [Bacteroidota bacterium]